MCPRAPFPPSVSITLSKLRVLKAAGNILRLQKEPFSRAWASQKETMDSSVAPSLESPVGIRMEPFLYPERSLLS